jgi:hypothetical protein
MLENIVEYQINWFHHLQRMEESRLSKRFYHHIHRKLEKYEADQTTDGRTNSDLNFGVETV